MQMHNPEQETATRVVVIGAGFGGLSAALRLRAAGCHVTIVEQHDWVGGKARTVDSVAGPVAAGPTVLTMRHVFDEVFQATGAQLEDYATLTAQPRLARHFWPDGSRLDLFSDRAASRDAIASFAGARAAREFDAFAKEAESLFTLFDTPMMQTPDPSLTSLVRTVLSAPHHLATLSPMATLASKLRRAFTDPRLRQLFGRYATYVGGSPLHAPALFSLIWRSEEAGVWTVKGGVQALAEAMAVRFVEIDGVLETGCAVSRIEVAKGTCIGVITDTGERVPADSVVFNGDPRALATGLLGETVSTVAPQTTKSPRSLSARVWSFAAKPSLPDLAHHNIFFAVKEVSEKSEKQESW